jgi:hypothetical protein
MPTVAAGSPCHAACSPLPPVRRGAGQCPAHPNKPKAVSPCACKHPVTPCAPPAPLMAAAASYGLRPAAHQAELASTFPCTYPSSPTYLSPPPSRHLAGTAVAAADAAGRQCPHLAGTPPTQPSLGIDPLGPKGRSPPAPGWSRPAVRRNLAGPPPAGAKGPNCESPILSRGPSAQQGYICNPLKILGACLKVCSEIVFDLLQKLVKCVEIRRKFRKMQN